MTSNDLDESATALAGAAWTALLDREAFNLINGPWAGRSDSTEAVARALLREGLERLAPVALDLEFDPEFYAEAYGAERTLSPAELYLDWLRDGVAAGRHPSAVRWLSALNLRLLAYPAAFDWRAYAAEREDAGTGRWSALAQLLQSGAPEEPPLVAGEDAVGFLLALGYAFYARDDPASVRAFGWARARGDRSFDAAHHLGDCALRRGDDEAALAFYREAAAHPEAKAWTFANAAEAAAKLGRFSDAFDMLAEGVRRLPGEPQWAHRLDEVRRMRLAAGEAAGLQAIAEGRRAEGEAAITAALDDIVARIDLLGPLAAPWPAEPGGRVVMLANRDLPQCDHYRVQQKRELCTALGRPLQVFDMRGETAAFLAALPGASAAIFYRTFAWPEVIGAMETARRLGVPSFYDVDDLIFTDDFPAPLETYGGAVSADFHDMLKAGAPSIRKAMSLCDAAIASTTILAEAMRPWVKSGQAFVLPNGLDSLNEPWLDAPPVRSRGDGSVTVFYGSGSPAHNSDVLALAGPGLLSLLARRPEVRLVLAGHVALGDAFAPYSDRIVHCPLTPNLEDYWALLAEMDINIAVLVPAPLTDAKSEIKWLEAAVFGVPSIVSDTHRYLEVLCDGEDAVICDTPEAWTDALDRLAGDAEARRRIGEGARRTAARHYRPAVVALQLETALQALPPPAAPVGGRRVMILADRIDAVDEGRWMLRLAGLGEAAGTRFCLATPGRGSSDGLKVAPLGVHVRLEMGGAGEGGASTAAFERALASWRPDLVQIETDAPWAVEAAQACQAARTPYALALRDGAWLGASPPRDGSGALDLPADGGGKPSLPALTARRRRRSVLDRAWERVALGTGTAEFYAAAEIRTVAVPGPVRTTPLSASALDGRGGRLRLAVLEGSGEAQPALVRRVRAALVRGRFDRLSLSVVELSEMAGETRRELWGSTSVSRIGRPPPALADAFWRGVDLLIALPGAHAAPVDGLVASGTAVLAAEGMEPLYAALAALDVGEISVPGLERWSSAPPDDAIRAWCAIFSRLPETAI